MDQRMDTSLFYTLKFVTFSVSWWVTFEWHTDSRDFLKTNWSEKQLQSFVVLSIYVLYIYV